MEGRAALELGENFRLESGSGPGNIEKDTDRGSGVPCSETHGPVQGLHLPGQDSVTFSPGIPGAPGGPICPGRPGAPRKGKRDSWENFTTEEGWLSPGRCMWRLIISKHFISF